MSDLSSILGSSESTKAPIQVAAAELQGLAARPVLIEASVHGTEFSPPRILGLPDAAVREAYHRVRTAFRSHGISFPRGQVIVNLAPASRRKAGSGFDLGIAIALACAGGSVDAASLEGALFCGELGLDGRLRAVPGILSMLELARGAWSSTLPPPRRIFCSESCAALVARTGHGDAVVPLRDLAEAIAVLAGAPARRAEDIPRPSQALASTTAPAQALLARLRGQGAALEAGIAATVGGHNLLLVGPPGCGKSLLARGLRAVLPRLEPDARLELARIYGAFSASSDVRIERVLTRGEAPFRAPHHSCSDAGLIGGGSMLQPGEVSLAHRGVLFLDELPEFRRSSLEALRQPLEEGRVVLRRARDELVLPARMQLIAAMNPCPCGLLGHPTQPCRDTPLQVRRYLGKISGPLLDRLDLQVTLRPVESETLLDKDCPGPDVDRLRARVTELRDRQRKRQGGRLNADLEAGELRAQLDRAAQRMLSARGRDAALSATPRSCASCASRAASPTLPTASTSTRKRSRPRSSTGSR